jgi:hypothetical protein
MTKAFTRREEKIIRSEFGYTFGNMAIRFVDRLAAADAESQRQRWVIERDIALSRIEACQECPACRNSGFWPMDVTKGIDEFDYVTRVCGDCGHCWRQK